MPKKAHFFVSNETMLTSSLISFFTKKHTMNKSNMIVFFGVRHKIILVICMLFLVSKVSATSLSSAPNWTVTPANFQYSMQMIVRLQYQGVFSNTPGSVMGVFSGNELRGTATAINISGSLYYFVTVYSNMPFGEVLRVKAYYSPNDLVYATTLTPTFLAGSTLGSISTPLLANIDPALDFPPEILRIPPDTTLQNIPFRTIDLSRYLVNCDGNTEIWTVSSNVHLTGSVVGNLLTVTPVSNTWVGTDSLLVTVTDQTSNQYSASRYVKFTVLLDYGPPVLSAVPDQTILLGGTFSDALLDNYLTYSGPCREYDLEYYSYEGSEVDPMWPTVATVSPFMRMVVRPVFVESPLVGSGSKLAAYVNNILVGTATQSGVAPSVSYAINLQNLAAGPITFKFFHDTGQYIYEIPTTVNFVAGGTLGSVASPYLLQCSPLLPVIVTGNTLRTTVINTAWLGSFPMNIMVYDCDFSDDRRDTVRVRYNVVPNNKPLFVTDSTINFQENSCGAVYDALAVDLADAEGNGLTYSIQGGADASKFSLNPATGVLSWNGFFPDYEQPQDANVDNHYEVVIRATNLLNLYTNMTISVEISDQTGESNTIQILGDRSFCPAGSVLLSVQGGTMYQWNTGSTAVSITVSTVGVYVVTVTSAGSCVTTSATITQNASPIPSIAIVDNSGSTSNDGSLCTGSSATLTASGGVAYAWSTGATVAALSVSPMTTTAYTVTVTNSSSCTATTSASITVGNFPIPAIVVSENSGIANNDGTLCYGASALLTASGGSTYVWNTAVSTAAISVAPTTPTTYTVTVSNSSGCISTATSTISVEGPVARCVTGSINVSIDPFTGVAVVPVGLVNNGSTDYCATPTITVTPASLGCSNLVTNNTSANDVTLTVSDYSPNTSTCTTNVIVSDNTAPVLVCPVNLTVNAGAMCTATVPSLTFNRSATSSPVALEYFDNAVACGIGFS